VKKPDLVMILDAAPDLLQKRKQEISAEESERQRDAYRALALRLEQGRIVDAANSRETVAAEAQKLILDFMAERVKKRRGS
jgi:thymidylate kinase